MIQSFILNEESGVQEPLFSTPKGYYVYGLYDPINHNIFYIGKGTNRRAWDHNQPNSLTKLSNKNDIIKNIKTNDMEYIICILKDNLSEVDAFFIENKVLENHEKYSSILKLTNVAPSRKGTPKKLKWHKKMEQLRCNKNDIEYYYNTLGVSFKDVCILFDVSTFIMQKYLHQFKIIKPQSKRCRNKIKDLFITINNGQINKRWSKSKEIPNGWNRGCISRRTRTAISLDYDVLYNLYVVQNLTAREVQNKMNTTAGILESNLKKYNIKKERFTYKDLPRGLISKFIKNGMTIKQIASELNTTWDIASRAVKSL